MCGILFSNFPEIDRSALERALDLMHHRGPDAGSIVCLDHVKLGHRRLKIVDLDARANQPFVSSNGRYRIIFNGEIYNFQELAARHNIDCKTSCDTEVLIELYVKLGPDALKEFYGMFSFVIHDMLTGDIFAARDRLGVKPLYVHENGSFVSFSSEIKPLKQLHDLTAIDPFALRQYVKARSFFNGRTMYKDISLFPAGHYYFNGKLTRYWDLPERDVYDKSVSDEEIMDTLKSAVDLRCIADVPVGSYLSGGVDSTLIAALSSRPHTWTVGFEDNNEFDWAELAAEKFSFNHHAITIADQEFRDIAKMLILHRGEPLSVPNEVLIYKMTKVAKEFNTVILSGEGADELFFGYDRIFRWAAENPWDIEKFDQLYSYGKHADREILEDILSPVMHRKTALDRTAAFFQIHHLHGLLRRLDNSTMMCSVEARTPFVDHRLVELMYGTPASYRLENGVAKAPLKRLCRNILPDAIIDRPKVGFPVPTDRLFAGEGSGMDKWLRFNLETLLDAPWADISDLIYQH